MMRSWDDKMLQELPMLNLKLVGFEVVVPKFPKLNGTLLRTQTDPYHATK